MLQLVLAATVHGTIPRIPTPPATYRGVSFARRIKGFNEKLVALTFDDGPSATITPQILKTLRKYDAKATFFVMGQHAKQHPLILQQIAKDGHAIGNHSWSHPPKVSAKKAVAEVDETQKVIKKVLDQPTQLFRPPYGMRGALFHQALKRDYAVIMWTASSADTGTKKSEDVYQNCKSCNPGDIILFHDSLDKQHTANALPRILESLSKKGYKFVTVPELLAAEDEFRRLHKPTKKK